MPTEHQELIVRGHERLACRLPAVLRIESPGVVLSGAATDGPDTINVDVVDCSAGGAGLQASVFIPRGCRLRLQIFPLESAAHAQTSPAAPPAWALDAPVRVQRVTMISRTPVYYVGAAFADLDAAQHAMVERLLERLRAAESTPAPARAADQEGERR